MARGAGMSVADALICAIADYKESYYSIPGRIRIGTMWSHRLRMELAPILQYPGDPRESFGGIPLEVDDTIFGFLLDAPEQR